MKKLIKYLREWAKDYNAVQKELSDMGLFSAYHQWGAHISYYAPKLSTHINSTDDKQDTISTKDK